MTSDLDRLVHALLFVFVLSAFLFGCEAQKPACAILRAASAACVVLEMPDGSRVQLAPEDLELAARSASARAAGSAAPAASGSARP